jgi:hypothetical protein
LSLYNQQSRQGEGIEMTTPIKTKKRARELEKAVREGLVGAEKALKEFIVGEGWVVLDYPSFGAWYDATLSGITLASQLQADAIYALLTEGEEAEEVAKKVRGIGPETVKSINRQRKAGVPANKVNLRGGNRPGGGRPASHLRLNVGAELITQLTEIGNVYGQTKEEVAIEFLQTGVAQWLPAKSA